MSAARRTATHSSGESFRRASAGSFEVSLRSPRRHAPLSATLWLLLSVQIGGDLGPARAQAGQASEAETGTEPTAGLGVERGLPSPSGPGLSGAELELATEELASQLRCPVCQGLSVADSPSESAHAMKAQVEQLLAEGYSPEQIVAYFERSYGEFVRLVPKPRGFNLLVFVLPALGLGAGLLLVVRTIRRRANDDGPQVDAENREDPLAAYRERVRRELSG